MAAMAASGVIASGLPHPHPSDVFSVATMRTCPSVPGWMLMRPLPVITDSVTAPFTCRVRSKRPSAASASDDVPSKATPNAAATVAARYEHR